MTTLEHSMASLRLLKDRTRNNYQLGRRILHMTTGTLYVTAYLCGMELTTLLKIVAVISAFWYLVDRLRIKYPFVVATFGPLGRIFFRDEEQSAESAAVPYQISSLLTLILFPKMIACGAILTLALADPFSAFVGIRYGTHRYPGSRKSIEGSLAFGVTSFVIFTALIADTGASAGHGGAGLVAALIIATGATLIELAPLPVDDNFSIPLLTGLVGYVTLAAFTLI